MKKSGGGGDDYEQIIVCCNNCGFVTVLNPLDDNEMDKHYSEGYDYTNYSSLEVEKGNYIERASKARQLTNALRLDFDSVLDVGASTGYLLSLFEMKKVFGVETSDSGVYTAKKRYGFDLYHGSFSEFAKNAKDKYDFIIMMHIMEHVKDLNLWMNDLLHVSSKYVYIEVPCLYNNPVEPYGLFAEEHLNYFTPKTLNMLFEKYGFQCIHLSIDQMVNYKVANGFPMIRAVFKRGNLKYVINELQTPMEYIKKYFSWSRNRAEEINSKLRSIIDEKDKVVIWGASFQTERFLAECDYSWMNLICLLDNSDMRCKYSLNYNGKTISVKKPSDSILSETDYIIITTYNNQEAIYHQACDMGYGSKVIKLY